MKINELRKKTEAELTTLLVESREQLRAARFDIQLKQSKNVREIRKIKKTIAHILTILKEKYE
ncbi:50S ribosomal protein L29 [Patescibacteria group bacterium AH-259-L05]|nr:50S ribosomal protein L29 [Patescibacteria group bacterium AH-259-L05]